MWKPASRQAGVKMWISKTHKVCGTGMAGWESLIGFKQILSNLKSQIVSNVQSQGLRHSYQ